MFIFRLLFTVIIFNSLSLCAMEKKELYGEDDGIRVLKFLRQEYRKKDLTQQNKFLRKYSTILQTTIENETFTPLLRVYEDKKFLLTTLLRCSTNNNSSLNIEDLSTIIINYEKAECAHQRFLNQRSNSDIDIEQLKTTYFNFSTKVETQQL